MQQHGFTQRKHRGFYAIKMKSCRIDWRNRQDGHHINDGDDAAVLVLFELAVSVVLALVLPVIVFTF